MSLTHIWQLVPLTEYVALGCFSDENAANWSKYSALEARDAYFSMVKHVIAFSLFRFPTQQLHEVVKLKRRLTLKVMI